MFRPLISMTAAENAAEPDKGAPPLDAKEVLERAGEFFLVGHIVDASAERVAQAMLAQAVLNKSKKAAFTLHMCSGGGHLHSGMMLATTIDLIQRKYKIPVTIRASGDACSMATVLLQYASKRIADSTCQFMLHDLSWGVMGMDRDMRDGLEGFQKSRKAVAEIYAARNTSGYNDPQWWIDNILNDARNHWYTAAEALELGIIDALDGEPPRPNMVVGGLEQPVEVVEKSEAA